MSTLDPHCLIAENTTNVLEYAGGPHMQLGLFLRRALITFVRRGTVFQDRVAAVIVVVAVVGGCVLFWDRLGWERTTIAGAALFGLSTFGLLAVILASIAMALAGARVPSIALEREPQEPRFAAGDSALERRDRAGHDGDRASQIGKLAGSRAADRCVGCDRRRCPAAVGVGDHRRTWLVGTHGRSARGYRLGVRANRQKAFSVGIGLLLAWIEFPLFVEFLLPRVWPGSPRWFVQALHWLVDSSPIGVGAGVSVRLSSLGRSGSSRHS